MKLNIAAGVIFSVLTFTAQGAERPMRILIVNDDGCQSMGSTSLQDKLTAKGFEVWLSAPASNQSGIGSAITFKPGAIFDVKKVGNKRYCFPGTPADALDFALLGLLRGTPPDLVISGVNDGPNTGMAQINSGTVSAAARAVRYGYPALAVSIGVIPDPQEMAAGWPATKKHWPDSVDYTVNRVVELVKQWHGQQSLLPAGTGLSINYPPLPASQIKGIKYIHSPQQLQPQLEYKILPDGKAQQFIAKEVLQPTTDNSDTGWLDRGYITYTVIDGNISNTAYDQQYQQRLDRNILPIAEMKNSTGDK